MGFMPHELDEPADTPAQMDSIAKLLRARMRDAILRSADNRLTRLAQARAIEAELRLLGFDATVQPKN